MTPPVLGRLERVPNLRDYWANEASDFTPWLASETNIELLSETIGIDLEVQQQEAAVGPFRADILCRDTRTDRLVLVENQLERTDHTHLGQLFTYAAGLDAVTVVWIAQRFTEEHRAALDWLNRITHEDFRFFGIEIELWRIGESAMAPKFNVVAKPNDWSKTTREAAGARVGESPEVQAWRAQYMAYWSAFSDLTRDHAPAFLPRRPLNHYTVFFGIGRSGYRLGATAGMRDKWVGVGLLIETRDALTVLDSFQRDSSEIERDLGFKIEWDRNVDRKRQGLHVRRDVDPTEQNRWPDLHMWTLDRLKAFDRVFRPRLLALRSTLIESEQPADSL